MKKILTVFIAIALTLTCTLTSCTHIHDDECGYDPETNTGCTHTCDGEILNPLNDLWPNE